MIHKLEKLLFYSLILFLPTQFGKHFWPEFSSVSGIRIDYLSPTIYFTDVLIVGLVVCWVLGKIKRHKTSVIPANAGIQKREAKRDWILVRQSQSLSQNRRPGLRPGMTSVVVWFVFIFFLLNILLSHNIFGGVYALLKFLEFSFVAYYVATFIRGRIQVGLIVVLFSIGMVGESVLAMLQYFNQSSLGGALYFFGERTFSSSTPGIANASLDGQLVLRPYGTFSHPNVLAGYLVVGLMLLMGVVGEVGKVGEVRSVALAAFDAGVGKLFYFFAFVFGSLGLFLTMSRVAIVFFVGSFLIILIKKLFYPSSEAGRNREAVVVDSRLRSNNKLTYIFLFFVFCSLFFVNTPLFARFSQTSVFEEAVVQREKLMDAAVVMIGEKPFTGVGLGNFLPTLSTLQSPLSLGLYLQPVHNIFLLVAAEVGVFGFVIFIWFLVKTLFRALSHRENHVFAGMLLSVIVLGFFDHYFLTLQQGQLLFALIVGLCWTKVNK